ncbi:MAG: restriction endonuclease subunit S [Archaeoglobaceae archaeon]
MKIEFYKETEFKDTEIGMIPKDWRALRASEIAEYINGYPFGPEDWKTKGIPIIRIQNLNDPDAEFNYFDGKIDEIYKVKSGDLLFSWSGSIGVYLWNRGDAVLNQHIFKVIPKSNIDKLFLYYVLFLAIEQLKKRVHGSTMKHFRRKELNSTFIPLPPIEEQKAIAEILSTVDEAIQKTNEVIAKTERLKKGLMQELLTKGIGHKEFKDTEIGRIPKDWEVVRLGDVVDVWDRYRVPVKEQDRRKGKYPYCGANGIIDYVDGYTHDGEFILLAEDGGFFGPYENSAYIMRGKFWANNHVHILKAIKGRTTNDFLMFYLNFIDLRPFLTGSTRPKLTQGDMTRIPIPLPPLPEQQKIAEILSTVDKKLEIERNEKAKLERIKQGLMDLLLTGKVRVKLKET